MGKRIRRTNAEIQRDKEMAHNVKVQNDLTEAVKASQPTETWFEISGGKKIIRASRKINGNVSRSYVGLVSEKKELVEKMKKSGELRV